MADMNPQEALAVLFQLRKEYARLVTLLETLEPGQWFEQSEAFRMQAHDALLALLPAVHGTPERGEYAFLCEVCHLRFAMYVPGVSDRDERFYCDGCRPQGPAISAAPSCSATS
jgi:hypothetical protein